MRFRTAVAGLAMVPLLTMAGVAAAVEASGGTLIVRGVDADVRQTHYDPLVLPTRAADGRWTTDVWSSLEGRVFNAGVRVEF